MFELPKGRFRITYSYLFFRMHSRNQDLHSVSANAFIELGGQSDVFRNDVIQPKLTCKFDLSDYPSDSHTCHIEISYKLPVDQVFSFWTPHQPEYMPPQRITGDKKYTTRWIISPSHRGCASKYTSDYVSYYNFYRDVPTESYDQFRLSMFCYFTLKRQERSKALVFNVCAVLVTLLAFAGFWLTAENTDVIYYLVLLMFQQAVLLVIIRSIGDIAGGAPRIGGFVATDVCIYI